MEGQYHYGAMALEGRLPSGRRDPATAAQYLGLAAQQARTEKKRGEERERKRKEEKRKGEEEE